VTSLICAAVLIYQSDDEILGISAYLIPTPSLVETLRERHEQGVRIRLLTNSLASTNHVPAHAAFRHHRKQLLEAGAELHVFRPDGLDRAQYEAPGFMAEQFGLHGKVIIFDDTRCVRMRMLNNTYYQEIRI
jgi:putative cardiolipin synthase